MAPGNLKIIFELDPIVKLDCIARDCVNHIVDGFYCNLKRVSVDEKGQCVKFEQKENK